MTTSFCSIIKDQDLFGHLITFNFGREGNTHNTRIGGVISIVVKVCFAIFVGLNVKTMVNFEDNKISKANLRNDVDTEPIPFDQMQYSQLVAILD